MSAEVRDAMRDLALATATLAAASVHLVGADVANQTISDCLKVSQRMDALDEGEELDLE